MACFFHLPKLFWDSPMLRVSIVHCSLMNSIPLHKYADIYLLICILMGIWVVFGLRPLQRKLLWTFVFKSVKHSFGEIPRSGMAGSYDRCITSILFYVFKEFKELFKKQPNCFPKWLHNFSFSPEVYENSSCSISSQTLGLLSLF